MEAEVLDQNVLYRTIAALVHGRHFVILVYFKEWRLFLEIYIALGICL